MGFEKRTQFSRTRTRTKDEDDFFGILIIGVIEAKELPALTTLPLSRPRPRPSFSSSSLYSSLFLARLISSSALCAEVVGSVRTAVAIKVRLATKSPKTPTKSAMK